METHLIRWTVVHFAEGFLCCRQLGSCFFVSRLFCNNSTSGVTLLLFLHSPRLQTISHLQVLFAGTAALHLWGNHKAAIHVPRGAQVAVRRSQTVISFLLCSPLCFGMLQQTCLLLSAVQGGACRCFGML